MASQYVVFACHMLGYSQFVEPGEMDRLSPECAMPWDAHRWKAPEAIGTDDALMMILDSRLVQAVPEEQRSGILAKIRHGAREGLKRHQRTIHGRAPTEEEARVIGALMEAAAARGEGPMVGIGHLVERYYGSRDHG